MGYLNDTLMWNAITYCDGAYDGLFFYAVKSTGICCRPSCKSRTPLRKNVSFYPSVSLAIQDGYRPCKRCRPDLIQSTEEEVIFTAKQIIEQEYHNSLTLDQLARHVGMSKYHLQRLFKKIIGISPLEYTTKLRMNEAFVLLQTTEDTITEIAHNLGYKSSAYFSSVFHHHTGYTPSDYRTRR